MRLKLAAIDLDGTLLGPDKKVSPENIAALRHLEKAGVEILVATGRHRSRISSALAHLPQARWAVTSQGAAVLDTRNDQLVESRLLPHEGVTHLVREGTSRGFTPLLYAEDSVRCLSQNDHTARYGREIDGEPLPTTAEELPDVKIHKIVWLGAEETLDALENDPGVISLPYYQVRTLSYMYEFLPDGIDKGAGVAAAARKLGILPAETAAFGDADNDISLFRWAGISYAMPHGTPGALRSAARLAPPGPPETAFARAIADLQARGEL